MKSDYEYCLGDKCIHRRGCRRYVSNHILEFIPKRWIDIKSCINTEPYSYIFLDRYRNSDGSKLNQ